ncbi:Hypothetical predicted protein [Cloeon dipterum]|uniref:Uncharacterized protein n=1 Tax=Cloeon dipterum TaxID=197152 RepID=A0A8S1CGN3_9INSE|nr:Hypothetical predicted protein [Cloeon dipterum]
MNSRRNSVEDDLRKQLLQEQRDKMVLLDQLAMIKVSICFHCQNDLPPIETRLQQTLERRAAKLNKLREKLIRVSHDLRTEECVLQNSKEELHTLKKESCKARHLIEQEQLLVRELKLTLDEVVQEKRALMARKEIELERTKESKSEIEHLQTSNYACQVQCDLLCTSEAVSEMQEQLRLLVDMKKNLDTEIYTINEYLILKRQELEEAKQALENLRKEEDELTTKLQLKKQMIEKMAHAEDELSVIKKKISYVNEEKEVELRTLAAEKDAIEEIKRQVKMCNNDLEQLKATKSSVMQESLGTKHHLQEVQREMKKIHDQKMQLTKKLAYSKEDLEESQRLLELCLKHQKESQDAVSSMKNRMLANFMQMRKELRTLQENKMRVSKEINTLKSLNRMGGTLATDDNRVKELVDNLIAEITRVTPAEKLQSIANHIQAYFSECLRKNENNAGTKGVTAVSTTEGAIHGVKDPYPDLKQ